MSRSVESYVAWLRAGNESEHLGRVRAVLDEEPRTRREVAELAHVSVNFAATALEVLVVLGEADERGCRGVRCRGKWQPARRYARRELSGVERRTER